MENTILVDHYVYLDEDFSQVKVPMNKLIYCSETVIMKNNFGNYWSWSFFIEVKKDITQSMLNNEPYSGKTLIKYVSGQVGAEGYPKVTEGKEVSPSNVGHKNELNGLMRGIKSGESELAKKMKEGYRSLDNLDHVSSYKNIALNIDYAPIPEQFKRENKNISFPIFVTTKYDGASLIICYHPDFEGTYGCAQSVKLKSTQSKKAKKSADTARECDGILAYTRNRKVCEGFNDIKISLYEVLKNYPGLFVVGEIYKEGLSRNKINSIHSQNRYGTLIECGLSFYIFDCFYAFESVVPQPELPCSVQDLIQNFNEVMNLKNRMLLEDNISHEEKMTYIDKLTSLLNKQILCSEDIINFHQNYSPTDLTYLQRYNIIKNIVKDVGKKNIQLVISHTIDNQNELDELYHHVVDNGGEGLVARGDVEYLFSFTTKKINPHNFKVKMFDDDEFEIADYKLGEGKAKHQIIFIVKANKGTKTFSAPMNLDENEMEDLYQQVKKDFNQFKGKLLTVRYEQISEYGIPLHGKGISIRDE